MTVRGSAMLAAAVSMALCAPSAFAQTTQGQQPDRPQHTMDHPMHRGGASDSQSGNVQSVSAEKLSDDPQDFYGKSITVKDDVANVLGPRLFTLDDGEFLGASPDILVFAPNAEAVPNQDSTVTVTGTVQKYTQADFERVYGWGWGAYPWGVGYGYGWYGPTTGPDAWLQYENRPIIIARSIKTPSGRELVSSSNSFQNQATSRTAIGTSGSSAVAMTDLSTLEGPSATNKVGDHVRLSGLTVDKVTSSRGFWAKDEGGRELFVGLDRHATKANLKAGERVSVAGKVMRVPSDKAKIQKSTWGLDEQDVNRLANDHVFIRANAIRPEQQSKG